MKAPAISYAFQSHSLGKKGFHLCKALKHDLFYRWIASRRPLSLLPLGNAAKGHQWTVSPENLNENAIVVSAGVGVTYHLNLV